MCRQFSASPNMHDGKDVDNGINCMRPVSIHPCVSQHFVFLMQHALLGVLLWVCRGDV